MNHRFLFSCLVGLIAASTACSSGDDSSSADTQPTGQGTGGGSGGATGGSGGGSGGGANTGGSGGTSSTGGAGGTYGSDGGTSGAAGSSGSTGTGGSGAGGNGGTPAAGQLTAGDWDDNLNFDWFNRYLDQTTIAQDEALASADRIVIRVTNEQGEPVANATVKVDDGTTTWQSTTASDGEVLFFPASDNVASPGTAQVTVTPQAQSDAQPTTIAAPAGSLWEVKLPEAVLTPPTGLDLAFVLDTTSSMADELSYINSELDSIVQRVAVDAPTVSMRFALVVYRDHGDEYVVRSYDFVTDPEAFRQTIAMQSADGGGDNEEAVDEAAAAMNELSWRTGNVVRVAFHIADAPPHPELGSAFLHQIELARTIGIHYFPVAASGIDNRAEYLMRAGAQWTSARYVFLTDDSGIGGAHAEPHIPCYFVQYLNVLVPRLILSELRGVYIPPDASDVLRTGGDPQDGACQMTDGTTTYAY